MYHQRSWRETNSLKNDGFYAFKYIIFFRSAICRCFRYATTLGMIAQIEKCIHLFFRLSFHSPTIFFPSSSTFQEYSVSLKSIQVLHNSRKSWAEERGFPSKCRCVMPRRMIERINGFVHIENAYRNRSNTGQSPDGSQRKQQEREKSKNAKRLIVQKDFFFFVRRQIGWRCKRRIKCKRKQRIVYRKARPWPYWHYFV